MRITIFGDTMCTKMYMDKFDCIDDKEYIKSFSEIKDVVEFSDYVILNLETPIAGEENGYVKERYSFNAPNEFATAIKTMGVDMVLCANNHILDRGIDGLLATIKNLKACGLNYLGIHEHKEDSYKIINVAGINIGLINFTYGTNAFANNNYLNKKQHFMIDLLQKQELNNRFMRKLWNSSNKYANKIKSVAKRLNIGQFSVNVYERRESDYYEKRHFIRSIKNCKKAGADYVIILPHIGGQYSEKPTKYTEQICDLAIKYGADVVVANHEHVIHPVNKSYLNDGKMIAYSIGNFFGVNGVICEPYDKKSEYSMAVHIDIDEGENIQYLFSLYKTIESDNILKVVSLYDLINTTNDDKEKESIKKDNDYLVNLILGTNNECIELKRLYEIKV